MQIITTRIHGVLDYLVGLVLIAMPWLLGFGGPNDATYVMEAMGVVPIAYTLITDYELGMLKVISMPMHLALDVASGLFLAVSPWLFSFSSYMYMPHLVMGLLEVLVVILSRRVPYDRHPR